MNASARKGIIVGLLSALFLAGQARADGKPVDSVSAGLRPAPGFTEKDIFGKETIDLQNYRGKVVILNFWATWCSPCLREVPALEALHASHGQVAVIGASVFSSDHDTEKFFKEHHINYPVFYGSYDLMEKYNRVASMPTTFIIDKHGEIATKVVGARSKEQYEKLIGPLLDQ